MQTPGEQRQGVAVSELRRRTKPLVKRAPNNAVMVDQRERFIRDDFFELIFDDACTGDVRRPRFCRHMVDPVSPQCVVV